jgi:lysophospholipase L1-like esterase
VRISWKAVLVGSAITGAIGALVFAERRSAHSLPNKRVALIGDSYAVGLGPELEKLIPNLRGEAHIGDSTARWAQDLKNGKGRGEWLADFRPTDVLVALGVNDGTRPNVENYRSIVQSLRGMGARVLWIAPPAAVNAPSVRSAIASLGIPIRATATPLADDGLHPVSYSGWAREIAEELSRA